MIRLRWSGQPPSLATDVMWYSSISIHQITRTQLLEGTATSAVTSWQDQCGTQSQTTIPPLIGYPSLFRHFT